VNKLVSKRSAQRARRPKSRNQKRGEPVAVLTAELEIGPARRKVYILDDLIHESIRGEVFQTLYDLPFYHADIDRPDTEEFRHMVHLFSPPQYEESDLLRALTQAARGFLEGRDHPITGIERIYLNFGLFGDFQFAHTDGLQTWTALVFVNKVWKPDWAGELLVYDDTNPRAPAWAIAPEPGRMVIFDGRIMHRGGVPSKHCFIPRLSLAIKLTRPPENDQKKPKRRQKKRG
jgi:hypothetical protein